MAKKDSDNCMDVQYRSGAADEQEGLQIQFAMAMGQAQGCPVFTFAASGHELRSQLSKCLRIHDLQQQARRYLPKVPQALPT
jgi:hypothetical protein